MELIKNKKVIKVIIIPIFLITLGILLENQNKSISLLLEKESEKIIYNDAKRYFYGLYKEDKITPKDNLTIEKINKSEKKINKTSRKDKEKMLNSIKQLSNYLNIKNEINNLFDNDTLKSNINDEDIKTLAKKISKLSDNYQKILKTNLVEANNQLEYIKLVNNTINNLFTNEEKK